LIDNVPSGTSGPNMSKDFRMGFLLDSEMTRKLLELSIVCESEPFALVNKAIEVMYKAQQRMITDGK
jgi:hypothetical protein